MQKDYRELQQKSPFWYFGSKRHAADIVWKALGDVHRYYEPMGGSIAVLLKRPHPVDRKKRLEVVNDIDGMLINFFRALQHDPQTVATYAGFPQSEADFNARKIALLEWKTQGNLEALWTDPLYYDARIAGWWLWVHNNQIGSSYSGPWWKTDDRKLLYRELVKRGRVTTEPGPGISLIIPNISRTSGNFSPTIADVGLGPSVQTINDITDDDIQYIHGVLQELYDTRHQTNGELEDVLHEIEQDRSHGFYPFTDAKLRIWLALLQARLRYVVFLCRDWKQIVKPTVLEGRSIFDPKEQTIGIFFDPPYSHKVRDSGLYEHDHDIAADVRAWCLQNGSNPRYRIVLAGFAKEGHEVLLEHGWKEVEWYQHRPGRGGYKLMSSTGTNQHLERLYLSPHCLPIE